MDIHSLIGITLCAIDDVHDIVGLLKEMIDRSGQMGVPVIDIDGKLIIGFDKEELEKALLAAKK